MKRSVGSKLGQYEYKYSQETVDVLVLLSIKVHITKGWRISRFSRVLGTNRKRWRRTRVSFSARRKTDILRDYRRKLDYKRVEKNTSFLITSFLSTFLLSPYLLPPLPPYLFPLSPSLFLWWEKTYKKRLLNEE